MREKRYSKFGILICVVLALTFITPVIGSADLAYFPEDHSTSKRIANTVQSEDKIELNSTGYLSGRLNDWGRNQTPGSGESNVKHGSSKGVYFYVRFNYTLKNINISEDTFTLDFEAKVSSEDVSIDDLEFHWSFGDGTQGTGPKVAHTFDGLGKTYYVTLEATASGKTKEYTKPIMGLGGISYLLAESIQESDNTELKQLESSLTWSDNSLERIYLATTKVALKVYSLAEEHGLLAAAQLKSALSEVYNSVLPIDTDKLAVSNLLDSRSMFRSDEAAHLLEALPGFKQLFVNRPNANSLDRSEVVATLTLPELYSEIEELVVFVEGLLEKLAPVVGDESFELQVPTCPDCTPEDYVALDNGEIAGILSYIASIKAGYQGLIAYTPGKPVMENVTVEVYSYGGYRLAGTDKVADLIESNFLSARTNGVLDLNGDGDGDSETGFEVLPATSLTLRNYRLLAGAQDNLLHAAQWLKVFLEDMPSTPGKHDPQISWPLEIYPSWLDEPVTVSKSQLIGIINTIQDALVGSTQIKLDVDFDGVVDYETEIDLSSLADDPIADLKTLLPDMVTTDNPDDPLVVIRESVEGVDSNWKIDGNVNFNKRKVVIDFPDQTLGGLLPNGDLNHIISLLVFGTRHKVPYVVAHWDPEAGKVDPDDKSTIDTPEILAAVKWWSSSSEVPSTGGQTIDLPLMLRLIELWSTNTPVDSSTDLSNSQVQTGTPASPVGKLSINKTRSPICSEESMKLTVTFTTTKKVTGLALDVTPPEGFNLVPVDKSGSTYRAESNQHLWLEVEAGVTKRLVYRLSPSSEVKPGTYKFSAWLKSSSPEFTEDLPLEEIKVNVPKLLELTKTTAYPNPVTDTDTITFRAEGEGISTTELLIYNTLGQAIYKSNPVRSATVTWNLKDKMGNPVDNGLYLYRLKVRGAEKTITGGLKRLLVIR